MVGVYVTTQAISQWISLAIILSLIFVFYRGGGGTALSTLSEANRILDKRVAALEAELKIAKATIVQLEARKDVTVAIGLALEPLIAAVTNHEQQESDRFDRTIHVLDLMAQSFEHHNGASATRTEEKMNK